MNRTAWLLLAGICAAAPSWAQDTSGGGGSASGNTLGFEAMQAAAVRPSAAQIEAAPPASPPAAAATGSAEAGCRRARAVPGIMAVSPGQPVELYGIIDTLNGNQLTITTRTGKNVTLDAGPALKSGEVTVLVPGRAVSVMGSIGSDGTVQADVIQREKGIPATWGPDCKPPG